MNLEGALVVVVGAGDVAARKIEGVLCHGARVRVIAPRACGQVLALAEAGSIEFVERPYARGDVHGARYVISASSSPEVNRLVYDEAVAGNALVNVVDVPELCTAIVPSVVRRGRLQVAVSTAGAAPSIARRLRYGIEEHLGQYWEDYLDAMFEVRGLVKERVHGDSSLRMPIYEALAESDLEQRFACGERPGAEQIYRAYVEPLLTEASK